MSPRITLTIVDGPMEGTEFVFDEPCQPVIGRANDCTIQLPTNFLFAQVSRHHCLLEIDPPAVRVRDLGSLNGTFVNGEEIGQHRIDQVAAEHRAKPSESHELKGGDQLQVGALVFRVGVAANEEPLPAVYLPPAFE
jgi:pSer/pThr/pTyr-binding forkhead associated (FHA) protein